MSAPIDKHISAVERALRYLKGMPDLKLVCGGKAKLTAFCGAKFGSSNNVKHNSTTGAIIRLGNGLILYLSRTQCTICGSRT